MTDEQRELLEAEYLRRLMRANAREWRKRILFDDTGPPPAALDPEQRQFLHRLRRVTRMRREEA